MLKAPRAELGGLRGRAGDAGLGVVDFPTLGQQTNDYDEFRGRVARTPAAELEYLGVAVYGPRRAVGRVTGNLPLLGRARFRVGRPDTAIRGASRHPRARR